VAHKAISKAEARIRALDSIVPSPRAHELAAANDKDPRHVQAISTSRRSCCEPTTAC